MGKETNIPDEQHAEAHKVLLIKNLEKLRYLIFNLNQDLLSGITDCADLHSKEKIVAKLDPLFGKLEQELRMFEDLVIAIRSQWRSVDDKTRKRFVTSVFGFTIRDEFANMMKLMQRVPNRYNLAKLAYAEGIKSDHLEKIRHALEEFDVLAIEVIATLIHQVDEVLVHLDKDKKVRHTFDPDHVE